MKSIILFIYFIISSIIAAAQIVAIPDLKFKEALISSGVDANNNGQIELVEAEKMNFLFLNLREISSLKGIEAFVNLTNLICDQNNLSEIDVSKNAKLTYLSCSSNNIKKIDISKNTNLVSLYCGANGMDSLKLKENIHLKVLDVSDNKTIHVDLSQCPNLQWLTARNNDWKNIDLSRNPHISDLKISGNLFETLQLENNYSLRYLECQNNKLTYLDLTANHNLHSANCRSNFIKKICINTFQHKRLYQGLIYIENPSVITICTDIILFQDPKLKQSLLGLGIDLNNDGNITFTEASNVSSLILDNKNLDNLSGLQGFPNLTYLDISNNNLTVYDSYWHRKLQSLVARNNKLSTLIIFYSPNLKYLVCEGNKLISLDISYNSSLLHLLCANNQLTYLTTSYYNNSIKRFSCYNNKLGDNIAYLPNMGNLEYLSCSNNGITQLNLLYNNKLQYLYCQQNKITKLITHNSKIKALDCSDNALTSLDISRNDSLKAFKVNNNNIDSICVSAAQLPLTNSWRKDQRTKWSLCGAPQNRSEEVEFLEGQETSVIYPNPASSEIRFQPLDPEALLILRDIHGMEITKVKGKSSIDVSSLAPGVYLGEVRHGNQTMVKKIIVE